MEVNPRLNEDINLILDVFSGGANTTFMAYKTMMEHLDKKDDEASRELIKVTTNFARFLRVSRKEVYGEDEVWPSL